MTTLAGASPSGPGAPAELADTASGISALKGKGTLVVTVTKPSRLGKGDVRQGLRQVADVQKDAPGSRLVVVLKDRGSGETGAVLLLLADAWTAPKDGAVGPLAPEIIQAARELRLCAGDRRLLCQQLDGQGKKQAAKASGLPGRADDEAAALDRVGHLKGAEPRRLQLPEGGSPGSDDSGFGVGGILLTVFAAGTVLFALAVLLTRNRTVPAVATAPLATGGPGRRVGPGPDHGGLGGFVGHTAPAPHTSHTPRTPHTSYTAPTGAALPPPRPPHRPRTAPRTRPSGPVRPATVCTRLHPQGYVELDGWLYRASWAEPHLEPPGPGERVDVAGRPAHDLLAYAPHALADEAAYTDQPAD
ncbi:hypothetical protein AB0M39_20755 [Streptomyces sp. NPDC051907]|uniref:hypothetical protein n=1 Tax=Streptomyces sp. NPDC051907 TaxID=3155284 RepID=UPI0034224E3D